MVSSRPAGRFVAEGVERLLMGMRRRKVLRTSWKESASYFLILALAFFASTCGGGGGGGGTSPPPPTNVTITLTPTTATVGLGNTQQFTATVSGTTNTAVTWSVNSVSGGNSSVGTITSTGLYTAPAAPTVMSGTPQNVIVGAGTTVSGVDVSLTPLFSSSGSSVTVKATSQADSTKSASATVTLTGISVIALGTCGTSQCSAGSTGVSVSRTLGTATTLFVVGYGIVPGTSYSVTGPGVVVTQPSSSDFGPTSGSPAYPSVTFDIVVSPSAPLGPRNLMVTDASGQIAAFVGGVLITP